jgi:hypothetical protein
MTTNTQPQTQQSGGDELHTDAVLHVKDAATLEQIELLEHIRKVANPHIENIHGTAYMIIDLIALSDFIQAREREAERRGELYGRANEHHVISGMLSNEELGKLDPSTIRRLKRRKEEITDQRFPKPQAGEGGEG